MIRHIRDIRVRGIIDSHAHIWTPDQNRFPHDLHYDGPEYQPASFTAERLLGIAQACGVERVILVQMSFYGTDNSYMLHAIQNYPGVFSGVAIVDYHSPGIEPEMARLHSLGVRGVRVDREWLETSSMQKFWNLAAEKRLAICPLVDPDSIPLLDRMCAAHPETTVVIDHMARIGIDGHIRPEDLQSLCRLARHHRVHVKVSAFYALGKKQYPYTDLIPMIHSLYDAYGPSRLMWGSDSPFQVDMPHSYLGSLELVQDRLDFLSPADAEWVLRKSAESVFFEPPVGY